MKDNSTGIIFDMDGTLWDSSEGVARSWSEVFERHPEGGRTRVTTADLQSVMGHTMDSIEHDFFPETDPATAHRILAEACENENAYLRKHGGRLYPDVKETLAALSQHYPLFIESNCQSGYIEAFLDFYGLGDLFTDHLCFGDIGQGKAEGLRLLAGRNGLSRFIYVGDIQGDYDATAAAGGLFIHAAWGFGSIREQVPEAEKFSDLPAVIRAVEAGSSS